MQKYQLVLKFRKKVDFRQYVQNISTAIASFNYRSKNRKLKLDKVEKDHFIVILESDVQLQSPSKALRNFSNFLLQDPVIKPFSVNRLLLNCTYCSPYKTANTPLTDGELLQILVKFIFNTDSTTTKSILTKRENLLFQIKKIVQNNAALT